MGAREFSRRGFLQASLALAGASLVGACGAPWARTEPARMARVGVLSNSAAAAVPLIEALAQGLAEHGYVDGRTVTIEGRYAEGRAERFPELAADLVRHGAEVLVTNGTPATRGAREATGTVPIVFMVADPVGAGLVASLARPGGTLTGLANASSPLAAKRLELLREVRPGLARVAVLANADNPAAALSYREAEDAARSLGLRLDLVEVRGPEPDLAGAFAAVGAARAEALLVLTDAVVTARRERVAELALRAGLPSIHEYREYAEAGGLLAYGPNLLDLWRRAGRYAARILGGATPADLPVELPTAFDFVVNLRTARALGLAIPPSVLVQATEVIGQAAHAPSAVASARGQIAGWSSSRT